MLNAIVPPDLGILDMIQKYVVEEAGIMVVVLLVIGAFLKQSKVPDSFIPWILLAIGVITAVALLGFNVQAVLQGVIVTGLAVFGHQLFKQTLKKE